jgi:hypothetical protein
MSRGGDTRLAARGITTSVAMAGASSTFSPRHGHPSSQLLTGSKNDDLYRMTRQTALWASTRDMESGYKLVEHPVN